MLPLRDENPTSRTAWVCIALIAVNVVVFLYQFLLGPRAEAVFIHRYGAVAAWLWQPEPFMAPSWPPSWLTLFTYMFLHGDWLHLGGNMLYLWIFGNNIEDRLGPLRFIIFYLLGGLVAGLLHTASYPTDPTPLIGASGAIAAVLGGYILLYPRAKVQTLVIFFFLLGVVRIRAVYLLGIWFVLQIISAGGDDGVAWMAHIYGFVCGLALIKLFAPPIYALQPVEADRGAGGGRAA